MKKFFLLDTIKKRLLRMEAILRSVVCAVSVKSRNSLNMKLGRV